MTSNQCTNTNAKMELSPKTHILTGIVNISDKSPLIDRFEPGPNKTISGDEIEHMAH